MGIIVTFPPPRRRRSAPVQTTDNATILLFMGVRYVRELETVDLQKSGPEPDQTDCEALPPLEIA